MFWGAIVFGLMGLHHSLPIACGKETKTSDAQPSENLADQFFSAHCKSCHAKSEPEGDFDLKSLAAGFADKDARAKWLAALEQINAGNMPPIKKPRPSAEEIKALTAWIDQRVAKAEEVERSKQGRVVLRRLNRNEYVNTVRDLLGVHVKVDDLFPPSTSTSGFDNIATSLHVSTYLLENYLEAADRALDEAIANGPRPDTIKQRHDIRDETTVKPTGSVYRHLDDGVAIFSAAVNANIQVTLWRFNTRHRGKYRFRISGYAYQTDEPVTFHVNAGPMNAAAQQYLIDYFEFPPLKPDANEPTVVEFTDQMEAIQTIRIVADGLKIRPWDLEKIGVENYKGPGIVVQWVEVEGPLIDQWPPKSHQQIFGDMQQEPDPNNRNRREVVSQQPLVDAERILRDFTRRAFRRPVTDEDVKPFMDRVRAKLAEDYSFEQAVRVGLKAVMVSSKFLFFHEQGERSEQGILLDDFALASRLSYFLWSSMPDEELFTLAQEQKLHQPDTLREQVDRMLRDPKAAAFTENFVGQWLALRSIDDTMPDELLYPEFDDLLKESMVEEVTLFFDEVLKNDLSLTNFVASDFTMLNGRLARHYGIEGVEGIEFRRVPVPANGHRGGILTTSAVLKVTANGTTTSPILRGAWVLDRILGTPPPKPTGDIEAIEPDIRGATTIRDQLAKHREVESCAICHVRIDPPGFALENFDVIGGWRENYRSIGKGEPAFVNGQRMRYLNGPVVDASDVLPDGRKFQDIDEYKQLLLEDKDQLARSLAEKLVAYATGAAPATADQGEIESIVAKTREKNYGFRSLVHEVVQSQIFRHK